jgi:hypothetical protein
MRKIEKRVSMSSLVSRFAFASWADVDSQFPTSDHLGSGSFQPSVIEHALCFLRSMILHMLSKRDALACSERLNSGPGVAQKSRSIFPVHLLSPTFEKVNILTTNDAALRACLADFELDIAGHFNGRTGLRLESCWRQRRPNRSPTGMKDAVTTGTRRLDGRGVER